MDPVVVKAVKSFAKQKKIVTHETIIGTSLQLYIYIYVHWIR